MAGQSPSIKIRLCVLGDGNVGKSALTIRYFQDQFVEDWDPTIEDLYVKQDQVDGKFFHLEVQDTAGQEQFALLREDYIQHAHGFLIVYAVAGNNAQKSMKNIETYFNDIKRFHGENIPIIIAANKIDLRREIETEVGEDIVKKLKENHKSMAYIETSAKTKKNVPEAFKELCTLVLREQHSEMPPPKDPRETKPVEAREPKGCLNCTTQ